MCRSIREMKLIYHLTSIENIPSIMANGLLSRKQLTIFDDIADPEIIRKREELGIDDCVPFHLFHKNPFDYRVQTDHGDKKFVYIAVWRTVARENGYKVIPRHPLACNSDEIYSYDDGFRKIEWDVMDRRDYKAPYPKNVCMAECLGPSVVPIKDFAFIYTKIKNDQNYLTNVAQKCRVGYTFSVDCRPEYFF